MAAIKRFFEKRKLELKFKKAGGGVKLTDDTRSRQGHGSAPVASSAGRHAMGQDARRAGEAALARTYESRPGTSSLGTSMGAIRAQVKRELEAEKKAMSMATTYSEPREVHCEYAPMLAVSGVFYHCPLIGSEVLPRDEMEARIEEFLLSQLPEEPEMTSALMIHTMTKNKEKVKNCIDIICKYLDNIAANPGEDKFCKVRVQNKVFQEKVAPLKGTTEFMQAAGFEQKMMPGPNDGPLEEYLVMGQGDLREAKRLTSLKEVLVTAEPIKPELDRNQQIFYPSAKGNSIEVPDMFYAITKDEIKKEQQRRQEAVEKLGMLRTKEMREREQMRELRRYRFSLIRVRFPNGVLLQGTFLATEKSGDIVQFVRDTLENSWMPFYLSTQTGHRLEEEGQASIAELGLAPASVVNFSWDPSIQKEIAAQCSSIEEALYLKEDLMANIQSL